MKTFLKALVLVPIAILALAFAVANRQVLSISFDPFSPTEPAFALAAPLFLLVFLLLMAGVLIGGIAAWLGQGRHRKSSRRAQVETDELHAEIDRLKTELSIQSRQITDPRQKALPALALTEYEV